MFQYLYENQYMYNLENTYIVIFTSNHEIINLNSGDIVYIKKYNNEYIKNTYGYTTTSYNTSVISANTETTIMSFSSSNNYNNMIVNVTYSYIPSDSVSSNIITLILYDPNGNDCYRYSKYIASGTRVDTINFVSCFTNIEYGQYTIKVLSTCEITSRIFRSIGGSVDYQSTNYIVFI